MSEQQPETGRPELARRGSPLNWPVWRQLTGSDLLGRGSATRSRRSLEITPRTTTADKVVKSVCPFCAVGCAQDVYVSGGKVIQIEGDDNSPISRGRLCPKGSASKQLVTNPERITTVLHRKPFAAEWEELDLETAMDMVAERVLASRAEFWEDTDSTGASVRRTRGVASLGGATLDNEENYLMKKLYTALGAIEVENQARI